MANQGPRGSIKVLTCFKKFDASNDNTISKADLISVMQKLDKSWTSAKIDVLFKEIDANGDGQIQLEEFVTWICQPGGTSESFRKSMEIETWEAFPDLKAGFDVYADDSGYIVIDNIEAIRGLAQFLGLDAHTVGEEMQKADLDANGFVGFPEFALWADRNTVGVPLGLSGIPDKRRWQEGMPNNWTTPPELAAAPEPVASSGFISIPEDPDTSRLEELLAAAKKYNWKEVFAILQEHPGYIDMRPHYRTYATIHQAAFQGKLDVCKTLVETYHANPELLNRIGEKPQKVSANKGKHEAAQYFEEASAESASSSASAAPVGRGCASAMTEAQRHAAANDALDHAKWSRWSELYKLLEDCNEEIVNFRPPYRIYGILHQVAFKGNPEVLQKLVEDFDADVMLKSKDDKIASQIAAKRGHNEAAAYLVSVQPTGEAAVEAEREKTAHAIITAAKNAKWKDMFNLIGDDHSLIDLRPAVRGWGTIHQVAYHGAADVLKKMVEDYQADVGLKSKDGKTACQIAEDNEKEDAVVYLQAANPSISLDDDHVEFSPQEFVRVTDDTLMGKIQKLFDHTHKKDNNWTRDRTKACGFEDPKTQVPRGYTVMGAYRNENPALWRRYSVFRAAIQGESKSSKSLEPIKKWEPLTMEGIDWSPYDFNPELNEWYLLHGSIPAGCSGISKGGFSMKNLGLGATGDSKSKLGLYGNGTYFADSVTKVDEYARQKVEDGEFEGCRCLLIVRVMGGRHYYTDKAVKEEDKPLFAKRVLQGQYHSTVGDRLKLKDTFREYVAYDASGTYPEYVVYFKRDGVQEKYT